MSVLISPSASERNSHTDFLLAETRLALDNNAVQMALGDRAIRLSAMLDSIVVANVRNGTVEIPNATIKDADSVVVVSVDQSEGLAISDDFAMQTPMQLSKTLGVLESWHPKIDSGSTYDSLVSYRFNDLPVINFHPLTRALTHVSSSPFSHNRAMHYLDAPPEGIISVASRPLILLGMRGKPALHDSEVAHELAHADLWQTRPVFSAKSQRGFDLLSLRHELYACDVGAAVGAERIKRSHKGVTLEKIQNDSSSIQLFVNTVRKKYQEEFGFNPDDPHMPTGGLHKRIIAEGMGNILHLKLDYESIVEIVDAYEATHEI